MPKIINLLSYDAAEMIEKLIYDRKLKKGDKLPGERELAQLFKMNRITLRQGIQSLIDQGVLYSIPNSGNYIDSKKATRSQSEYFFPYADSYLKDKNYQQITLPLLDNVPSSWNDLFEQNQGNIKVKRTLEMIDHEPVAITRTFQKKASLNHYGDIFLSKEKHLEILQRLKMRVYTPLEEEIKLLKINQNDNLLMISVALVNDQEIFAIAESICVGTRIELAASITVKDNLDA